MLSNFKIAPCCQILLRWRFGPLVVGHSNPFSQSELARWQIWRYIGMGTTAAFFGQFLPYFQHLSESWLNIWTVKHLYIVTRVRHGGVASLRWCESKACHILCLCFQFNKVVHYYICDSCVIMWELCAAALGDKECISCIIFPYLCIFSSLDWSHISVKKKRPVLVHYFQWATCGRQGYFPRSHIDDWQNSGTWLPCKAISAKQSNSTRLRAVACKCTSLFLFKNKTVVPPSLNEWVSYANR